MGHNRLGSLPRTFKWRQVVELLADDSSTAASIASLTAEAADDRFREAAKDPAVGYCVWLLARITTAARRRDFIQTLNRLGIEATAETTVPALIALIGDKVRVQQATYAWHGHFGDYAALALRTALADTVETQGRSLFGSNAEDVHHAFRAFSSSSRFGELTRRFFADFTSRSLRSFVDRELRKQVGTTASLSSIAASTDFLRALTTHTWQASVIVQDFAADWHSKHSWETRGQISHAEVQRFVAVSLRKLRAELKQGAG